MKRLRHETRINASPERVWQALTDFAAYPEWNPFIRKAEGQVREGARLEVRIQPSGARGMTFRPRLLRVTPGRELRWLGRLWLPGLFDGEHVFRVEPQEQGGVNFVQEETFRGVLAPLLAKSLDRDTLRGFREMNEALKARAEG